MTTYSLNLNDAMLPLKTGHLRLGGENKLGEMVGVTNQYLTRNDKPFFGISGEFQFSRYPAEYWEDELLKMKASGINTVATYFFWIHHEPTPGSFDWTGQRNVRRFVELCAKHQLWVIARVGPFVHGECRNGGLPDWLYGMPFQVRSNDPEYLAYVNRYYQQIGRQVSGLMFKDGGPVICVQIENEYEHTGAPWDAADRSAPVEWLPRGADGEDHMRRLKAMAEAAGLTAPLYTVTGWGSPVIEDETLPVHGGYAYPVWVENPGPSNLFLFYNRQAQPHHDIRYKLGYHYPLLNAEMQGGIQVRYGNRPVVPARSTEALSLVQVGCGSNFLGYYTYHGGSNPLVNGVLTNEILHPQVSYDFQSPIDEYGEVRDACRGVKVLHLFLQTFGPKLAEMPAVFPAGSKEIQPSDTKTLRYAARAKDGAGYLFLNNFQDHLQTQPVTGIQFALTLGDETLCVPNEGTFTLQPEVSCIFPLNLDLPGARLVYATAQPLTVIETDTEIRYFFYAPEGIEPEYCMAFEVDIAFSGETGEVIHEPGRAILRPSAGVSTESAGFAYSHECGKLVRVITLTRWEAEHAWRGCAWGQERLVISAADPTFTNGGVELHALGQPEVEVLVFPPIQGEVLVQGAGIQHDRGGHCSRMQISAPAAVPQVTVEPRSESKRLLTFSPDLMNGIADLFVEVDYTGDIAGAYINGQLVADHYNNGTPWRFGLKRFLTGILDHGMVLSFRPLRKGTIKNVSNAMAARMEFEGEQKLEVHAITFTPEYVVRLS